MTPSRATWLYIAWLCIAAVYIVIMGFAAPALVSAESDAGVTLGFMLIALVPVFLAHSIYHFIRGCKPRTATKEKSDNA